MFYPMKYIKVYNRQWATIPCAIIKIAITTVVPILDTVLPPTPAAITTTTLPPVLALLQVLFLEQWSDLS
jgi:hypothetical protein